MSYISATRTQRLLAYSIDQLVIGITMLVVAIVIIVSQQNTINALAGPYQQLRQEQFQSQAQFAARYRAVSESDAVQTPLRQLSVWFVVYLMSYITISAEYYTYFTAKKGATLGKRAMKIHVLSLREIALPSIRQSLLRYFLFVGLPTFSILLICVELIVYTNSSAVGSGALFIHNIIDYLIVAATAITIFMILFRSNRRGLHDLAAQTVVVKNVPAIPKASDSIDIPSGQ